MTVTVLTSLSGSPGVSTTALGLALHWPESSLLVDGDSQQAFLAGYLRAEYQTGNELMNVVNAARITADVREALWRQSVPLPDDNPDGRRRLLLPGLTSGQQIGALHQSWTPIARSLRDLGDAGVDVIVDYGRMGWLGIHPSLLEMSHHVLLLSKPTLRAVGAARWGARRLTEQAAEAGSDNQPGLLLVRRPILTLPGRAAYPPEQTFSDHEVAKFLSLPVRGTIPFDPTQAALLSEGGDRGPKFTRSGYAHALTRLAQILKGRMPAHVGPDSGPELDEGSR